MLSLSVVSQNFKILVLSRLNSCIVFTHSEAERSAGRHDDESSKKWTQKTKY